MNQSAEKVSCKHAMSTLVGKYMGDGIIAALTANE
jgi:hypothetical protein